MSLVDQANMISEALATLHDFATDWSHEIETYSTLDLEEV